MDSFDILVIILSVFLAIFLIVAIIATIYIIKVVKKVNELVAKAENAVDQAESIARNLQKWVTPAYVAASMSKMFKKLRKK